MTALLRYDASGVPQILHNQPAFLDAQDAVLAVFGDGDQVAGFPVADGEFHGAEADAGLGFELVTVQHSGSGALKREPQRLDARRHIRDSVRTDPPLDRGAQDITVAFIRRPRIILAAPHRYLVSRDRIVVRQPQQKPECLIVGHPDRLRADHEVHHAAKATA